MITRPFTPSGSGVWFHHDRNFHPIADGDLTLDDRWVHLEVDRDDLTHVPVLDEAEFFGIVESRHFALGVVGDVIGHDGSLRC
jgi:hypothetical protein